MVGLIGASAASPSFGAQRVRCLSIYIYRTSGFFGPGAGDPLATRKRKAGSFAVRFKGHPHIAKAEEDSLSQAVY